MVQGRPPPAATTILIVEDDEATREFLTLAITTETPYHVFSLGSATETFQRLNEIQAAKPALLILDYRLASMTAGVVRSSERLFLPSLLQPITSTKRPSVRSRSETCDS